MASASRIRPGVSRKVLASRSAAHRRRPRSPAAQSASSEQARPERRGARRGRVTGRAPGRTAPPPGVRARRVPGLGVVDERRLRVPRGRDQSRSCPPPVLLGLPAHEPVAPAPHHGRVAQQGLPVDLAGRSRRPRAAAGADVDQQQRDVELRARGTGPATSGRCPRRRARARVAAGRRRVRHAAARTSSWARRSLAGGRGGPTRAGRRGARPSASQPSRWSCPVRKPTMRSSSMTDRVESPSSPRPRRPPTRTTLVGARSGASGGEPGPEAPAARSVPGAGSRPAGRPRDCGPTARRRGRRRACGSARRARRGGRPGRRRRRPVAAAGPC